MALEAQNNPFTSILMVEAADPEALASDADPAAGQRRLVVGSDHLLYLLDDAGVATEVGTSTGLTDPMTTRGDIIIRNASNVTARLGRGSASQVLTSDGTDVAWATPAGGGTVYAPPNVSNGNAGFAASGTTVAVTMTAPTAGDNLVMVIYANGRGANSITQTNVVWTQRYTGNGNGAYLEVWTGVVSASAGTTATANFTGSNGQYAQTFVVDAVTPFTSATALTTTTNTVAFVSMEGVGTTGSYYIWAVTAWLVGSSYSALNMDFATSAQFGGAGRYGLFRLGTNKSIALWSLSNSTGSHFAAIVAVS